MKVDIDESRIQNNVNKGNVNKGNVKLINSWFIRTFVAFAQYFFNQSFSVYLYNLPQRGSVVDVMGKLLIYLGAPQY